MAESAEKSTYIPTLSIMTTDGVLIETLGIHKNEPERERLNLKRVSKSQAIFSLR